MATTNDRGLVHRKQHWNPCRVRVTTSSRRNLQLNFIGIFPVKFKRRKSKTHFSSLLPPSYKILPNCSDDWLIRTKKNLTIHNPWKLVRINNPSSFLISPVHCTFIAIIPNAEAVTKLKLIALQLGITRPFLRILFINPAGSQIPRLKLEKGIFVTKYKAIFLEEVFIWNTSVPSKLLVIWKKVLT